MEPLYKNEYGGTFKIFDSQNPQCEIQLDIDSVGIFLSKEDVNHILTIVKKLKSHALVLNALVNGLIKYDIKISL